MANGAYSYMPMNFNDVPSGLVVLLALLILNNWFVLCDQYVAASATDWTRLFFVSWWVCGVCVLLNVLVAFVLEVGTAAFQHHLDAINTGRQDAEVRVVEAGSLHALDSITDKEAATAVYDQHQNPILLKVTHRCCPRFRQPAVHTAVARRHAHRHVRTYGHPTAYMCSMTS